MKIFEGKKVLVTGGAGFLGTNFILRLLESGAQVRATLHERPAQIKDDRIEWLKADLTSMLDCQRVVEGMDFVFLCAANTSGAAVMTRTPMVHVTPNVLMNTQMLEAAYQAEVKKVLFVSSSAAYPEVGERAVREEDMFQGDPPEVYYPVGWMKRYAEILCKTYATKLKRPMPCLVVRPSNVYGPCDKFEFDRSHVTAALLRRVVERHDPLDVWGTGEDERDLIFVDDFIRGCFAAFARGRNYDVFNIASGQTHSIKKILQTLLEVDGFQNANVQFKSDKPRTIRRRVIDISFAEREMSFKAEISLKEGFSRVVGWYREQKLQDK